MASQKLVRAMKGIGIWLPTVLLGLLFVMQGMMKLSGMPALRSVKNQGQRRDKR